MFTCRVLHGMCSINKNLTTAKRLCPWQKPPQTVPLARRWELDSLRVLALGQDKDPSENAPPASWCFTAAFQLQHFCCFWLRDSSVTMGMAFLSFCCLPSHSSVLAAADRCACWEQIARHSGRTVRLPDLKVRDAASDQEPFLAPALPLREAPVGETTLVSALGAHT